MNSSDGSGEVRLPWSSSITEVRPNELRTYGVDQRTIIREFSFEEMVFLVLRGRRPDPVERTMLRAVLVSVVSHGITGQSTMAVVAAADCPSDFLHALVAGFSVGAGPVHLGATAAAMVQLQELARLSEPELDQRIEEQLDADRPVTGFGHRFHSEDPRAHEILELARESGFDGPHLRLARRLQELLRERRGIALNIAGANAAILLDLGFDPRIAQLFIVLGRSPMYAAVYLERLAQGRDPFQRIEVVDVLDEGRAESPADPD
jgi:citrate synthase